jgi:hypothetical protein
MQPSESSTAQAQPPLEYHIMLLLCTLEQVPADLESTKQQAIFDLHAMCDQTHRDRQTVQQLGPPLGHNVTSYISVRSSVSQGASATHAAHCRTTRHGALSNWLIFDGH